MMPTLPCLYWLLPPFRDLGERGKLQPPFPAPHNLSHVSSRQREHPCAQQKQDRVPGEVATQSITHLPLAVSVSVVC